MTIPASTYAQVPQYHGECGGDQLPSSKFSKTSWGVIHLGKAEGEEGISNALIMSKFFEAIPGASEDKGSTNDRFALLVPLNNGLINYSVNMRTLRPLYTFVHVESKETFVIAAQRIGLTIRKLDQYAKEVLETISKSNIGEFLVWKLRCNEWYRFESKSKKYEKAILVEVNKVASKL